MTPLAEGAHYDVISPSNQGLGILHHISAQILNFQSLTILSSFNTCMNNVNKEKILKVC